MNAIPGMSALDLLEIINELPDSFLQPFDPTHPIITPIQISEYPVKPCCRIHQDLDGQNKKTIWIAPGFDRNSVTMTLFDGWKVSVSIPLDDWYSRACTPDDVRFAMATCINRVYQSPPVDGRSIKVRVERGSVDEGTRRQDASDEEDGGSTVPELEPHHHDASYTTASTRPSAPEPLTPTDFATLPSPSTSLNVHCGSLPTSQVHETRIPWSKKLLRTLLTQVTQCFRFRTWRT